MELRAVCEANWGVAHWGVLDEERDEGVGQVKMVFGVAKVPPRHSPGGGRTTTENLPNVATSGENRTRASRLVVLWANHRTTTLGR